MIRKHHFNHVFSINNDKYFTNDLSNQHTQENSGGGLHLH